ncbi:MAG: hypothetical protein AAF614_00295 [Chloroflexota bacterium]
MADDLIALLQTFDGKHVTPFQEAARALPPTPDTIAMLCNTADSEETAVEIGATWLIKHFLEQGVAANEALSSQIIALLATARQPDSILHLLQSLPHITIPTAIEATLHQALTRHLTAKHKFVRAWSYNGLGLLAKQNRAYREETLALFAAAQETEAASVKVRIRKASSLLK